MDITLSTLTERMQSVCKELYSDSGASDYRFNAICPKGSGTATDAVAMYDFGGFAAALIFNAKIGGARNVLECRISLEKGPGYVDFSLYDLMYLLNENDFKCYLFPSIDSPDRLENCLKVIFTALTEYKEQLRGIGNDEHLCERAKSHKKKEMLRFFKHDIFSEVREQSDPILAWRMRGYREWYVSRYCSGWYKDYMNENYERAAKRLGSYDSKCDYELRMHRFLKTLSAGASYVAAPPEANTFSPNNAISASHRRPAFITAFIIFSALSFLGYAAAGYAAYCAIYYKALFCTALYSGWIPIAALLCSFPTGYAFAHVTWRKLLSKRECQAMQDAGMDVQLHEHKERKGSVHSSVVCGLIIMAFAAKSGIAIYDSGIVDNSSLFETHSLPFSNVQQVYYEKQSGLYHITFSGSKSFTCSENMAKEYILSHVDEEVKEIDKIEEIEEKIEKES